MYDQYVVCHILSEGYGIPVGYVRANSFEEAIAKAHQYFVIHFPSFVVSLDHEVWNPVRADFMLSKSGDGGFSFAIFAVEEWK